MKGGKYCSLKGLQLSLTLVALLATTIFLLTWERNPFHTSLLWTSNRYTSPDLLLDAQNSPSVSIRSERHEEEYSHSTITTETKTPEFGGAPINLAVTPSLESKGAPMSSAITSSVESQGGTPVHIGSASFPESQGVAPVHIVSASSPESKGGAVNITSPSKRKVCNNYAKGRWVADSRRPLYSGFACKQWLSIMWACRMTKREDFYYEGYRWQPENCEMPEFEESAFLRKMQDKTIAFIGDSLGRQQFQSLMCMATGGEYNAFVQDVGKEYGLVKAPGAIRPDGWAYRFPTTNTTILYYWSASLSDLVPLNATDVAMHLDRPPAFMRQFLHRFHVLVLNTGHHWNRGKFEANRWVMHVNGKPNEDKIPKAKNLTVRSVVRWVDSQLPSHPGLKAFFRTISPRHFKNGDWNTGGSCGNTIPLSGGSEVTQDGSSDALVEIAVKGTKVKILDITAISELRDEGHVSRYTPRAILNTSDCLHWCLPGIPDTWNEILVAQL